MRQARRCWGVTAVNNRQPVGHMGGKALCNQRAVGSNPNSAWEKVIKWKRRVPATVDSWVTHWPPISPNWPPTSERVRRPPKRNVIQSLQNVSTSGHRRRANPERGFRSPLSFTRAWGCNLNNYLSLKQEPKRGLCSPPMTVECHKFGGVSH